MLTDKQKEAEQIVLQAIADSAFTGSIARIDEPTPLIVAQLEAVAEDRADLSPTQEREYWGTDELGADWRIHLPPVEGTEA